MIRSTATLACVGRRQAYFREEFLSTLEILHRGDVQPERLIGSWAGAFGPTQFMPTSFKRFAVDFDGDGHRDVVDSVGDLVASTANNLKKDGWVPGATWGYEVVVPQGLQLHAGGSPQADTIAEWEQHGHPPPERQAVPQSAGEGLSAGAGRLRRAELPDAAEFQRHHEVQPGRSLCAGDRASGRPLARRRGLRPAMAAA